MSKKINLYFFGETGVYNEYNPAYVCNKRMAPEILYIIAYNEPFSISKKEIIEELKINGEEFNDIISSLKLIDAVDIKEDKYKVNFTVFLEKDMPLLDEYFLYIGKTIGDKIIKNKELIYEKISALTSYSRFSRERLLYHIICDRIFDGTAFDFFTRKSIFSSSKMQPGDRDYIVFGYEDSEKVEDHSNKILCSSNNYRSKSFRFNSFGDSEGTRKDMYRFFRKVLNALEAATPFNDLNFAYIKLLEDKNREIAEKCGDLIWRSFNDEINCFELGSEDKKLADFLKELGYLSANEDNKKILCNVPVFQSSDDKIINEVSESILNDISDIIKTTFERFKEDAINLTPIKHKIDINEIAIELWHQVFGFINEYLVSKGFVESPEFKIEEGRYLRSLSKR